MIFSNLIRSSFLLAISTVFLMSAQFAHAKRVQKAAPGGNAEATLSAEEKAKLSSWRSYINDKSQSYAQYPIDMCGKEIPIDIDASLVKPFIAAGNNAELYCEEARTKLSTMCRNAEALKNDNKKKITSLINRIKCQIGKKEDEVSFKIQNGVLIFSIGPKGANISEELLKFLDATNG